MTFAIFLFLPLFASIFELTKKKTIFLIHSIYHHTMNSTHSFKYFECINYDIWSNLGMSTYATKTISIHFSKRFYFEMVYFDIKFITKVTWTLQHTHNSATESQYPNTHVFCAFFHICSFSHVTHKSPSFRIRIHTIN